MHPLCVLNVALIYISLKQNVTANINQLQSWCFWIHHLNQWINSQQQAALTMQMSEKRNKASVASQAVLREITDLKKKTTFFLNKSIIFIIVQTLLHFSFILGWLCSAMINLKPFFRYYHLGQKMRLSGLRFSAWQKSIPYPSDQKEMEVQGELKPFLTSVMCNLGVQLTLNMGKCSCCALVATNSLQHVMKTLWGFMT